MAVFQTMNRLIITSAMNLNSSSFNMNIDKMKIYREFFQMLIAWIIPKCVLWPRGIYHHERSLNDEFIELVNYISFYFRLSMENEEKWKNKTFC